MARICLVTGTDSGMFSQLLLLGGSLRRYSPNIALHVCDFGLTEAQRAYIRRRYVLLDKPTDIQPRHPWDYKANLGRYVAAVPFYRNQIVGDVLFTSALFGAYAAAITLRRRMVSPA